MLEQETVHFMMFQSSQKLSFITLFFNILLFSLLASVSPELLPFNSVNCDAT